MKKITLLILIVTSFTFKGFAQFPENFQSSATIPTGWSSYLGANGLGTTENWKISTGADNYAYVLWEAVTSGQNAEDWLVTPQFTVDASKSILTFDVGDFNPDDYGSKITIRVSTSSQTTHADFTTIKTILETDIFSAGEFQQVSVNLATSYLNQAVYVAFVMENNDGDGWGIDNVNVVPFVAAPNPVITPNPINAAPSVALVVDTDYNGDLVIDSNDAAYEFTWEDAITGEAPSGYIFNFGLSSPPNDLSFNAPSSGFTLYGLSYSTTYYWQIIAYNAGGNAIGSSIWSFTTGADPSLSINEPNKGLFSVYPNPVKDQVHIKTTADIEAVSVSNQLGQRVMDIKKTSIINNTVDLSSLAKGMYFMNVKVDNKSQAIKIIKE